MAFFDVYFSGPNISAPVRWELVDRPYVEPWLEKLVVDPDDLNPIETTFCSSDEEARNIWRWVMSEIKQDLDLNVENVLSIMRIFVSKGDLRSDLFQAIKNVDFWIRSYSRSAFEGDITSENAGMIIFEKEQETIPFKDEYLNYLTTFVEYGDLVIIPNYADIDASYLTFDSSVNTLSRCGPPVSLPIGFNVDFSNLWANIYGRLLELSNEHKQFISGKDLKTIYKSTGVLPLGRLVSDIDFGALKRTNRILKVEVTH